MKYAHLEKDTNKLLGWYADDIHCKWIEPVYEEKISQEEEKDEDGNIIKEKIAETVLVKDGYYDISNIPIPNIEVSEDVWQEAININANCYEDEKFIVKDFRTNEEVIQQELEVKINEAKLFLDKTDKKVLPDYEFREEDNTLEWYIEERKKARAFIRDNK